jgi:endonuclease/exonuclease/phosphatase family metal-dependent hydrolase
MNLRPLVRYICASIICLLVGCQRVSDVVFKTEPQKEVVTFQGEAATYRVASWNVRNLFDSVDDSNNDEVLEKENLERKLGELATVIGEVGPDFIALQEVENLACLEQLNARLSPPYPQIGLIEGNDSQRGIDIAFMSRLPVSRVRSHRERILPHHPDVSKRYHFSRDCLEVHLASDPPAILLLNHLKSSRGEAKSSAAKRRVQSLAIVEIWREVDADGKRAVVVLGDLNDRPDSWALEPLFSEFYDPFTNLPSEERVTHRYRKEGSALDHILLDPEARAISGDPKVWKTIARKTSDHSPVSLEVRLRIPNEIVAKKTWVESD